MPTNIDPAQLTLLTSAIEADILALLSKQVTPAFAEARLLRDIADLRELAGATTPQVRSGVSPNVRDTPEAQLAEKLRRTRKPAPVEQPVVAG